jgi:hypothetical protein
MIQFHRYRIPGEPVGFVEDIHELVDLMCKQQFAQLYAGIDKTLEMAKNYRQTDRMAAILARMAYWGGFEWEEIDPYLPDQLPRNFLLKQEIVGCLGFERAARKYNIDETEWYLYQGFAELSVAPKGRVFHGHVSYRPRNSGLFSIIENIVAAAIDAELRGYRLKVDLSGNWWSYEEPFQDVFRDVFEFTTGGLPMLLFEDMRARMLCLPDNTAFEYADLKEGWYREIAYAIKSYAGSNYPDDVGTMFIRGGDKLRTETILPPLRTILNDLDWMGRFVRERHLLSDDPTLATTIKSCMNVVDRSDQLSGGYHHLPNRKVSCIPILEHFVAMTEAKYNFSCPSANLVNAANWSRMDAENISRSNPVWRYLLI